MYMRVKRSRRLHASSLDATDGFWFTASNHCFLLLLHRDLGKSVSTSAPPQNSREANDEVGLTGTMTPPGSLEPILLVNADSRDVLFRVLRDEESCLLVQAALTRGQDHREITD